MKRRHILAASAGLVAVPFLARPGAAQQWPGPRDRIQFVVPFNPGGSADTMARSLAQFMPHELGGTSITVTNRPGASGATGATWFSQLRDDGSTFLVMQAIPFLANAILLLKAPVRWEDFHVLNVQWVDSAVLAVPSDSPYRSLKDLVEAVRAKPGAISSAVMAGSGAYIQHHILLDRLGLPRNAIRYVTYDGGAPVRSAVAGGHVDMTIVAARATLSVRDKVRALAIVDDEEDTAWQVPPVNALLQRDFGITMPLVSNYTVAVIARRSFGEKHPDRLERFLEAYRRTLDRPDYLEFVGKADIPATWRGPERSAAMVDASFEALKAYAPAASG